MQNRKAKLLKSIDRRGVRLVAQNKIERRYAIAYYGGQIASYAELVELTGPVNAERIAAMR